MSRSGAEFLSRFGDVENCWKHLERSRREVLNLVQSLSDEALLARPGPETWSPAEVLEHVALTEESAGKVIRRMGKVARGEGEMFPAPPPIQQRQDGRRIAPPSTEPSGKLNRAGLLERLASVRERLHQEAEGGELHTQTYAHPAFGSLTGLGWLQTLVYHERHHLAQLQERLKGSA
jgi:hypothetical protein